MRQFAKTRRFRGIGKRQRRRTKRNPGVVALQRVNQLIKGTEEKYIRATAESMNVPIAGAAIIEGFGPYCTQGDAQTQRQGLQITIKSLAMRFNVKLGALEADGTCLRLMVVLDRRPAGANAAITDMLVADTVLSPYLTTGLSKGRFQFLMDKTMDFSAQEGEKSGKFFLKRNINVEFDANVGDITDVQKNNFLVVGLSKGNAAAITINYSFIFKFTDM